MPGGSHWCPWAASARPRWQIRPIHHRIWRLLQQALKARTGREEADFPGIVLTLEPKSSRSVLGLLLGIELPPAETGHPPSTPSCSLDPAPRPLWGNLSTSPPTPASHRRLSLCVFFSLTLNPVTSISLGKLHTTVSLEDGLMERKGSRTDTENRRF